MIRFLILAVLSLLSASSFCQHTQLSLSDDFKIAERDYKDETVANSVFHNNYFYTATNSGIGGNNKWLFTKLYDLKYAITISKFDKNMKKISETELDNGSKLFGPLQPKLLLLNDKLCLAYFQSDDKTSFNLYLSLVDDEDLKLKEPKKICTIQQENVGVFKLESVVKGGLVFFTNTADNSKTLVGCNSGPNTISTFVIDDQLNIIKKSVVHTNTSDFEISKVVLTKDNLECLLLRSDQDTKLVCINPEGKKTEIKITIPGGTRPGLVNATTSADSKYIYIYSSNLPTEENDQGCNGFFLSQLNCSTLQLAKPLVYQFSPEFIEEICRKGGGTKHKKDYFMYNFDPSLVELGNGEVAILGSPQEESNNTISKVALGMNDNYKTKMESTTTLNTGPILAFFPNKNGKTFEYAIVPRKSSLMRAAESGSGVIQIVQSPFVANSSTGFIVEGSGNDIIILYNDNEDNLAKDVNEKIVESHSTKNMVLAEALIDKDKKLQYRKQIGQNIKGAYTYFLGNAVPVSSSALVFPIAKQGAGFNARKIIYTNWCFLDIK